jgi:methionyl-tRNA synthetase
VYVWVDALTNYISALGFGSDNLQLFQKFWPADVHLVGKDILRFHCVYWPAFLMSASLPLPKQVFGHGWWLKDEKKMSKSLGNVVRPDYLVRQFGADPLRYFFLREMTFGQDASFSDEAFLARYNADLANGLGNTFARVTAMARRYFAGKTPPESCNDSVLRTKAEEVVARYLEAMEGFEFNRALEATWELLAAVDAYVTEKAPWSLFKAEGDFPAAFPHRLQLLGKLAPGGGHGVAGDAAGRGKDLRRVRCVRGGTKATRLGYAAGGQFPRRGKRPAFPPGGRKGVFRGGDRERATRTRSRAEPKARRAREH